jgi:hypothetical protein
VRLPTFIITGTTTDFPLLNQQQSTLVFKMSKKIIWLVLIRNLIYLLDNIGFENFLLENTYGNITVKGNASVLLKLEVLKLIPLYYFMLKIKEIVVFFTR